MEALVVDVSFNGEGHAQSLTIMIAQAFTEHWLAPFLQFGVGAGVLFWFMFRLEPILRQLLRAMDRMSRTLLLFELTIGTPVQKDKAQALLEEVEAAERERKPKLDHDN